MMKLSGLAVPSCCCGSSQRVEILVCHASTKPLLGAAAPAARALRTKGAANAVAAIPAVRKTVRRVSPTSPIVSSLGSTGLGGSLAERHRAAYRPLNESHAQASAALRECRVLSQLWSAPARTPSGVWGNAYL